MQTCHCQKECHLRENRPWGTDIQPYSEFGLLMVCMESQSFDELLKMRQRQQNGDKNDKPNIKQKDEQKETLDDNSSDILTRFALMRSVETLTPTKAVIKFVCAKQFSPKDYSKLLKACRGVVKYKHDSFGTEWTLKFLFENYTWSNHPVNCTLDEYVARISNTIQQQQMDLVL